MKFFTRLHQDEASGARVCRLEFSDGPDPLFIETPLFMPVGTKASVKGLWQHELEEIGYKLILTNTYHLKLRPGDETIQRLGGIKKFISWQGAILSDSGGFQAFSLADNVKLHDNGIEFASHIDGNRLTFTPANVIDIQCNLGSDIMMVLDDCAPGDADMARLNEAIERTHRWALESINHFNGLSPEKKTNLFGIIQGGCNKTLRKISADYIQSLPFSGIAIGGLSVGEPRPLFFETLNELSEMLDPERPRYLMGVGTIPDFLEAVRNGIDLFDCVLPTRNGRNGQVITSQGKYNIRNSRFLDDANPPDQNCKCRVCSRYSRAYLRHLFNCGEMLGPQMVSYHNLYFIFNFMAEMRLAIKEKRFMRFYDEWRKISFS